MGWDGKAMKPSDVDARTTLLGLINFELELIRIANTGWRGTEPSCGSRRRSCGSGHRRA
jgi:hypothetical protein